MSYRGVDQLVWMGPIVDKNVCFNVGSPALELIANYMVSAIIEICLLLLRVLNHCTCC